MDWAAFISTMVGAGVSIVTSLVVFGFTSWTEKVNARNEKKSRDAFAAFRGFQKLVAIANELTNIQRYIDEAFDSAHQNGLTDADPFEKVQPLVGATASLESVSIDEMFFLVELKQSPVLSDIELIFHRARNTTASVEKYNSLRMQYNDFIESRMEDIVLSEGTVATIKLDKSAAKIVHVRGATLNNLLGQIMSHLEKDCKEAKRLAELFVKSAKDYFGPDFPDVKLEWMQ